MPHPSLTDLFRRFQPRFRSIALKPVGFNLYDNDARFRFSSTRSMSGDYAHFNLRTGELPIQFRFDPENKRGAFNQLFDATWKAILEGPLADRAFYTDPMQEEVDDEAILKHTRIRVLLSHSGEPIKGLFLPEASASWPFFIPSDTPERRAMEAAIELERRQAQELAGQDVRAYTTRLEEALAAVA